MALRMAVRVALAATIACMIVAPASAHPAPGGTQIPVVATVPGSVYFGYVPPVVIVEQGGTLTYSNFDSAEHDFVQDVEADGSGGPKKAPWCKKMEGPGHGHHSHGCPVFWTPLLASGESAPVKGLENVKPGTTYTFFCTKHHNMRGTLIVE